MHLAFFLLHWLGHTNHPLRMKRYNLSLWIILRNSSFLPVILVICYRNEVSHDYQFLQNLLQYWQCRSSCPPQLIHQTKHFLFRILLCHDIYCNNILMCFLPYNQILKGMRSHSIYQLLNSVYQFNRLTYFLKDTIH